MTAADEELDRVVAWLRGEAADLTRSAELRAKRGRYRDAHEQNELSKALRMAADALARHEHRSEADG